MGEDSTLAEVRQRRGGRIDPTLLAVSLLVHVLAVELLLLATGGSSARGSVERPIEVLFPPRAAVPVAAQPAAADPRQTERERQELAHLVQPATIPDLPAMPDRARAAGGAVTAGTAGTAGAAGAAPAPDSAAGLPVDVGGDVTRPEILEDSRVLPDYPAAALHAGREGVVVIRAVIDERGRITEARLLRGIDPALDEAALAAIRRWRFRPATRFGKPVRVNYILSVDFRL
jgi:periplasmic protein TonB